MGEVKSNIKKLQMRYQHHRHTFPKVEAFATRFYFTLHFLLHKEPITFLNSSDVKSHF